MITHYSNTRRSRWRHQEAGTSRCRRTKWPSRRRWWPPPLRRCRPLPAALLPAVGGGRTSVNFRSVSRAKWSWTSWRARRRRRWRPWRSVRRRRRSPATRAACCWPSHRRRRLCRPSKSETRRRRRTSNGDSSKYFRFRSPDRGQLHLPY